MDVLDRLDAVVEHGTSCITLCIPPRPGALAAALDKLKLETGAAAHIKSRL